MSSVNFLEKLLDGVSVQWKPLEDACRVFNGFAFKASLFNTTGEGIPVIRIRDINTGFSETYYSGEYDEKYLVNNGDILIGMDGDFLVKIWKHGSALLNQRVCRLQDFEKEVLPSYIYYISQGVLDGIHKKIQGSTVKHLSSKELGESLIPIPPISVQNEIVRILDAMTAHTAELTAELTARKKQYNYYRDKLLSFEDGEVEWKAIEDVFDIFAGGDVPKEDFSESQTDEYNIPILSNGIDEKSLYGWTNKAKIYKPSLTVSARGTIGWTSYREKPFFPIVRLIVLTPKTKINLKYAYYFMKTIEKNYKVPEAGIPQLTKPMIKDIKIPIPHPADEDKSLEAQNQIVAILDKFDSLTASITEGLPREIELRQKQYAYYRDLLLSFPKPPTI